MSLGTFLRGRPLLSDEPTGVARLRVLSGAERAQGLDALWGLDWWLRGRLLRLPGYVEEADASPEERAVRGQLRALAALLAAPSDDPTRTMLLFRAVVAPLDALPRGGWPALAGRVWRTARRPLQSWTDSLPSARAFAQSLSGRASLEPGTVHFVVEARVPVARVLLPHEQLVRFLRDLGPHLPGLAPPEEARSAARALARCLEVLDTLAQHEVIVDLPRGEVLVDAVHPDEEDSPGET